MRNNYGKGQTFNASLSLIMVLQIYIHWFYNYFVNIENVHQSNSVVLCFFMCFYSINDQACFHLTATRLYIKWNSRKGNACISSIHLHFIFLPGKWNRSEIDSNNNSSFRTPTNVYATNTRDQETWLAMHLAGAKPNNGKRWINGMLIPTYPCGSVHWCQ